jgi:hypothetical protein
LIQLLTVNTLHTSSTSDLGPESEIKTIEEPLSGPATGLVITSTLARRFVYWPDRKPADLTYNNSCCVAYLDSLPFQEGTPLAPTEEHTPIEVAITDSSLGTPNSQVVMAAGETPGPSGTRPNRYLDDISVDELSTNAPADETTDDKNAQRDRNRKRNKRRRRLRETLPIRKLNEALDQVANRVHDTPEQCLMYITTTARLAKGLRAGEVIAKLVEDAYFMRVDNRVTQVPPLRTHEPRHHEAASRSPIDGGRNRTRGEQHRTLAAIGTQLEDPPRAAIAAALVAVTVAAAAHHMALAEELAAVAIAEAEATRIATPSANHMVAMMPPRD